MIGQTGVSLLGLHHVTATTEKVGPDLEFFRETLGLSMVKRTVNFDDPKVYHFYFAPQEGEPGTVFTTFPYAGQGIRRGTPGHGQVYATAFSVPASALPFWQERFRAKGQAYRLVEEFGRAGLAVRDPSGLEIEIRGYAQDDRPPAVGGGVGAPFGIRGLGQVGLRVQHLGDTIAFLETYFGFELVGEEGEKALLRIGEGGPGREVMLWEDPRAEKGKGGMGIVHHVAFQVKDQSELAHIREFVAGELKLKATEIKDRKYFQSIYFRIPAGVLFEIATSAPGFTVDEPAPFLGEKLMLPEWAEKDRDEIEKKLPVV